MLYRLKMGRWLLMAALSGLLGCSEPTITAAPVAKENAREQLLQADLEFAALAFDAGVEQAYAKYLADDAVQLPDGGLPLTGKETIMANVSAAVAESEFSLSWEPLQAEVSASGDLGYTWGNYYLEYVGEEGERYTAEGKYANVWRLDSTGWRVVLDISNQNEIPFPEELGFDFMLDEEPYSNVAD